MKTAFAGTVDDITNGYSNEVAVVVHGEWSNNRLYRTVVDNTPSEDTDGYEIEMFPIESITKPNRPTSGINKAIVGQAFAEPDYHDTVPAARYYLGSPDDLYKYWQSPLSAEAVTFNMDDCAPQILYVEEDDEDTESEETLIFYLPSSGAAAVTPAYDGLWTLTGSADQLAMSTTPANTANASKGVNETVSGNVDALIRQYVGPDNLTAGTKEGSFRIAICAEESVSDAQMILNAVIKVVSSDGSVVRGVLWAGQGTHTSTNVSTDMNYEFSQTPTRVSRLLWGTFTPVDVEDGDRLVLEIGYSDTNANTTGRTGTLHFGDQTADTDLAFTVDTGSVSTNRPFFEVTLISGSSSYVPKTVIANKIHFTVENTYAEPVEYDVQIMDEPEGSWVTVASDIAIPDNGKVELWYNDATWTQIKVLGFHTDVHGLRLVVNKMDKEAYFNLIELGTALELDLSNDVVTVNTNFNMGEPDFLTPLGKISSNNGSVVLFNEERTYTNENEDSILYGLLDKGVKISGWYKYDTDAVQDFEMFSDEWNETDSETTVALVDNSKFFMDIKPPVVLYQNVPVQEAVWRICDLIGFTNYEVSALDLTPHAIIDIFWTDGEKTAWELFGELARATQTAIYFDSYGILQVKTRDSAWDNTKPAVHNFIRETVPGGQLANIVSLTEKDAYEANKVTVNWKPTHFSEQVGNVIPFEVVWEPEGTVVLRASELARSMTDEDTSIYLKQRDGSTWPWKGMCQIEGEWISYEGKEYIYYDDTNTRQTTIVNDFASQQRLDEDTDPLWLHLNHYTGKLIVTERGVYNTEARAHSIDLSGWTKTRRVNYTTNNSPCGGIKHDKANSVVSIEGNKGHDMQDYTFLHRGNGTDAGYWYLGTRMKIDKSTHTDKVGGIFFNADGALGEGYFLEVMATARMDGKMRNTRNEVIFYSMKSDGTKKQYGGKRITMKDKSKNHLAGAKVSVDVGSELAVPMDKFIDFDITFEELGNGDHRIQVWANGSYLFEAIVPNGSGWQQTRKSRFGMYARGHSKVTFDYIYAVVNAGYIPPDAESHYDRIEGGYVGGQWLLDWTYETREIRKKVRKKWTKVQQKYNQRFYDEFGPVVHEIRKFDVKFTGETPSLQSKLYMSNTTQVACVEYWADPKNAHFILANISRNNAVVNGDDELTAQGNGTINHKLFVYGRPVLQKDANQVIKEDAWAQRRRGVIEVEYDSNWIQNEAEAEAFGDWLTTRWSRSDSTLELEVFGNPLVELTDVVYVDWHDIQDYYYIVSLTNSFDRGLTTSMTLRRVG